MRRLVPLVLTLVALLPLPGAAATSEAWSGVQQALLSENADLLESRLELLRLEGRNVGVERLTPYASALSLWASQHPGEIGEMARAAAESLDPHLPHPVLLSARWRWQDGAYLRAAGDYVRGLLRFVEYERTRHAFVVSTGLWLVSSFLVASLIVMVVVVVQCLRRIVSDAVRMGRSILRPANAAVFAIVVIALPLFGGLGPVWCLVYLFALSWCYLGIEGRVGAVVMTFVLGAVVPFATIWQSATLRSSPITSEVAGILEERRLDLAALREFADAEEVFRGNGAGHLILGELLRMHGEAERARIQFQQAATASVGDPRANVFLGNLAMEDGDVARAVGLYAAAAEVDSEYALAFHNLSSAYDQSRRFQEGDEARSRAREIAGGSTDELGVGAGASRLRYPRLGRVDVERFASSLKPEQQVELGLATRSPDVLPLLAQRESAVFWLGGLLGCAVLALRARWLPPSRSCSKCGNVYRVSSGGGEAQKYCSQCVSVFLKRDLVSIEQQTQKMRQIRRWELREMLRRRVGALVAPGYTEVVAGHFALGMILGVVAWALLIGALVWVPRLLGAAEPEASSLPIQAVLLALWIVVWGRSVATAWNRS